MSYLNGTSKIGIALNNALKEAGNVYGKENDKSKLQQELENGVVFDIAGKNHTIKLVLQYFP